MKIFLIKEQKDMKNKDEKKILDNKYQLKTNKL
jgi:hypothetical protein